MSEPVSVNVRTYIDHANDQIVVEAIDGPRVKSFRFSRVFATSGSTHASFLNACEEAGFTPAEASDALFSVYSTRPYSLATIQSHMRIHADDRIKKAIQADTAQRLAAKEKRDRELVALLVGDKPSAYPSFASVAQPEFRWEESAHMEGSGGTNLPTPGASDKLAKMVYPFGDTPWARAVKLHELLHARFTPEIMPLFGPKGEAAVFPDIVRQIAEDIRLAAIARERGLIDDDVFFPEKAWNVEPEKPRSDLDKAMVMMSNYGQPLEGGWDHRDLGEYYKRLGGISTHARGVLQTWQYEIGDALSDPLLSPQEQFMALANATDTALTELAMPPPPPLGGGDSKPEGNPESGDKSGGGAGSGEGNQDAQQEPQNGEQKSEPKDQDQTPRPVRPLSREAQRRLSQMRRQQANKREELREARRKSIPPDLDKKSQQEISKSAARSQKSILKTIPSGLLDKVLAEIKSSRSKVTSETSDFRGHGHTNAPWTPGGLRPPPPTKEVAKNYSLDVNMDVWGDMVTKLAPLERNFKALVKRPGAAAPDGPAPRHLHRWFGDKQLFVRHGLRRGGALLIDISGSMGWAWKDTLALIEATPAMTIALYSGYENTGQLTIIAKDGRLVAPNFSPSKFGHGSSNTVDGPALAWLARQPRPRVWFSDGGVHGSGGKCGQYNARHYERTAANIIHQDVKRLTRLGAIHRTVDVNDVKKIFLGMKVGERE